MAMMTKSESPVFTLSPDFTKILLTTPGMGEIASVKRASDEVPLPKFGDQILKEKELSCRYRNEKNN